MKTIFLLASLLASTNSSSAMISICSRSFMQPINSVQRCVNTSRDVEVGAMYEHYKRNASHQGSEYLYKVTGVAHHSEDLSKFVVYQALYATPGFPKNSLWVRPYDMFIGDVEINGVKVRRFTKIEDKDKANWIAVYGEPEKLDQK